MKKDTQYQIRLSTEELTELKALASNVDMTISDFIRSKIFPPEVKRVVEVSLKKALVSPETGWVCTLAEVFRREFKKGNEVKIVTTNEYELWAKVCGLKEGDVYQF